MRFCQIFVGACRVRNWGIGGLGRLASALDFGHPSIIFVSLFIYSDT